MPAPSQDLTHHHILLHKGDYARVGELYGKPTGVVIRDVIRRHIEAIETRMRQMEMEDQNV